MNDTILYISCILLIIIIGILLYKYKYKYKYPVFEHIGTNHVPLYKYGYPGVHPVKGHIHVNNPRLSLTCDKVLTNPIEQNNNRSIPLAHNMLI